MTEDKNQKKPLGDKETESGIDAAIRNYASRKYPKGRAVMSGSDWEQCMENALEGSLEKHTWQIAWTFISSRMVPYVLSSMIGGVITGVVLMHFLVEPVSFGGGTKKYAAQTGAHVASPAHYIPDRLPLIPENKKTYIRAGESSRFVVEPGTRTRFYARSDSAQILLASRGILVWQTDSAGTKYHAMVTPHGILETSGALVKVEINDFETQIQILGGALQVTTKGRESSQRFEEGNLVVVGTKTIGATEMDKEFVFERGVIYQRYIRWLDNAQKSMS